MVTTHCVSSHCVSTVCGEDFGYGVFHRDLYVHHAVVMLIVTGLLQLGQNGTLELRTKAMPRQQEHISSFGPFQKKVCFEASRVSCVWSC